MLLHMRSLAPAFILLLICTQLSAGCGSESPSSVLPAAPTAVPPPVSATPSTFSLTGKVYDTANRPIAGAIVEVLDGANAGHKSTTDATGQFWFTGVFEEGQRLRATRENYYEDLARVGPHCERCNPHLWVSFRLGSPIAPANIAGNYTLTIEAAAGCTAFPGEVRTRTYDATIAVEGPQPTRADTTFLASIRGAALVPAEWQGIRIFVAGDHLEVEIGDLHGQPGVIEALGDDAYYSFGGWAATTVDMPAASTITAEFEGEIVYCVMKPGVSVLDDSRRHNCAAAGAVTRSSCPGGRMTFTRR